MTLIQQQAELKKLQDTIWCLQREVIENIERTKKLSISPERLWGRHELANFKRLNAVLNSLDRLEVRGRDSAGISLLFIFSKKNYDILRQEIAGAGLEQQFKQKNR